MARLLVNRNSATRDSAIVLYRGKQNYLTINEEETSVLELGLRRQREELNIKNTTVYVIFDGLLAQARN